MFETIIVCGFVLGIFSWDIQFFCAKRKARRNKTDWYPKAVFYADGISHVDVSKLTTAQLAVYLEDIKPK